MTARHEMPILHAVQTPEPLPPPPPEPDGSPARRALTGSAAFWALGERLTWLAGLVLALSSLTGWYSVPATA